MSKLPHTTDFNKMGLGDIELLDPNDVNVTGKISRKREFRVIPPNAQFPLLQGWSEHFQSSKFFKPDYSVEQWDQARWDQRDEQFLRELPNCTAPEEVDHILPDKWRPHRKDCDSDPRLERVTKLCTTMVNRLVDWQLDRPGGWKPASVADWKNCQVIESRINDMLAFLEATLGEAVGIDALKDPNFVRRCWRSMSEAEHSSFEDSIEQSAATMFGGGNNNNNNHHQQRQQDETSEDSYQLNRNDRPRRNNNNNNNNNNNQMMMMTEDYYNDENNNSENVHYQQQQQQFQAGGGRFNMMTTTIPNQQHQQRHNPVEIIRRANNNNNNQQQQFRRNNSNSAPVSLAGSTSRANSSHRNNNNNNNNRRI